MVYTSFLFKCHTLSHHSQNGAFPGDWSGTMCSGPVSSDPLHWIQLLDLFVSTLSNLTISPLPPFCSSCSISHVVCMPFSRPHLPFLPFRVIRGEFSPSPSKTALRANKKSPGEVRQTYIIYPTTSGPFAWLGCTSETFICFRSVRICAHATMILN